jgi:hypothetical protein
MSSGPAVSEGISTSNLAAGAVTRAKMAAVGQQASSVVTAFTTASATFVDVTGLTVNITTAGRPIVVMFISPATGAPVAYDSAWFVSGSPNASMGLRVVVSGSATAYLNNIMLGSSGSGGTFRFSPAALNTIYVAPAGTFTLQAQVYLSAGTAAQCAYVQMVAYEL